MTAYKPYVPQYKEAGIEPLRFPAHTIPTTKPQVVQRKPFLARPVEEPVQRTPFITAFTNKKREAQSELPVARMSNVPYAEQGAPIARTTSLPNVGNNMETTWTSLNDFSIVENTTPIDPNHPMIDNNEVISDAAFRLSQPDPYALDIPLRPPLMIEEAPQPTQAGDYYLVVKGEMVANGNKESIHMEVEALMYGEHPLSKHNAITPEDILVLKRVPVNVGVFLSE
jgi:hypothetical protein